MKDYSAWKGVNSLKILDFIKVLKFGDKSESEDTTFYINIYRVETERQETEGALKRKKVTCGLLDISCGLVKSVGKQFALRLVLQGDCNLVFTQTCF